ncbi:hypothetical protein K439DRAFT_1327278, partial [Ramaria rubella]
QRDPVTFQYINALHHHLDLTNSFGVSVFAIATITFWSCCRLGELLILTLLYMFPILLTFNPASPPTDFITFLYTFHAPKSNQKVTTSLSLTHTAPLAPLLPSTITCSLILQFHLMPLFSHSLLNRVASLQ